MAHAVILHRAKLSTPSEWIERIAVDKLSSEGLKRRLRRTARGKAPKTYLVRDSKGFRLRQIRYHSSMGKAEKRRIWDCLEAALKLIAESS